LVTLKMPSELTKVRGDPETSSITLYPWRKFMNTMVDAKIQKKNEIVKKPQTWGGKGTGETQRKEFGLSQKKRIKKGQKQKNRGNGRAPPPICRS